MLGDLTTAANGGAPIVLAPGASFVFNHTTTVLNAGAVTNTVGVVGNDDDGTQASAQDTHALTVTDVAPSITIDKNGPTTLPEGQTATYAFTITYSSPASTDPVTVTSVSDDVLGDLTFTANSAWIAQGHSGPILLTPGVNFAFSFTSATLSAGSVTNTVTVTGQDDENTPTSDQDIHTLIVSNVAPALTVDKIVPASMPEGQSATYIFAITNDSSASNDAVTVTSVLDNVLGDLTAVALAALPALHKPQYLR